MGAERVDYYSEEEYQQALIQEQIEYERAWEEEAEKAQQAAYEAEIIELQRQFDERKNKNNTEESKEDLRKNFLKEDLPF